MTALRWTLLLLSTFQVFMGCDPGPPPGRDPPSDGAFYFPMSIETSRGLNTDPRYVYVVSSNFDQRFNAGWISVIDLGKLLEPTDFDGTDSHVARFVQPADVPVDGLLRTPALGARMAVSHDGTLGVTGYRGSGMVALVELGGQSGSLRCGDKNAAGKRPEFGNTDCDKEHLVDVRELDFGVEINRHDLRDPYAAAVVSYGVDEGPVVGVGYLGSGWLTLFRVAAATSGHKLKPETAATINTGGLGKLLVWPPVPSEGTTTFLVAATQYLGSTSELSGVYSIDVERLIGGDDDAFERHDLYGDIGGTELYDLVLSPDGSRAFALNRSPDSVVMMSIVLKPGSVAPPDAPDAPEDRDTLEINLQSALPLEGRPTSLAYVDRQQHGDLIAAASIDGDTVFLLTVVGNDLRLIYRLDGDEIGEGPITVTHARWQEHELLLVGTFYDHGVSVFDVTSNNPLEFEHLVHVRDNSLPSAQRSQ